MLIVADLIRTLGALVVAYAAFTEHLTFIWLGLPLALMGAASGLYYPANGVIIRFIAGSHLVRVNQAMALAERLSLLIGPVVGALLVGVVGLVGAYIIDAATFIVSVVTAAWAGYATRQLREAIVTATQRSITIWRLVRTTPTLLLLLTLSLITSGALNALFAVGFPLLAFKFDTSAVLLGSMIAVFGGGAVLGTVISHMLTTHPLRAITGSIIMIGAILASLPWFDSLPVVLIGMLLVGLFSGIQTVWYRATLQQVTPVHAMARITALSFMTSMGGAALWQIAAGMIGARFQTSGLFTILGGIIVIAGTLGFMLSIMYIPATEGLGGSDVQ